jgi:hypothetical protein
LVISPSFFSSFDSVVTGVGVVVADGAVVVLVLALGGLSDLAPAKALPKRLFPPALNLGLVSLPLISGAGGGRVSDEVEEVSVDEEVVKPDIRDASDATGSVSFVVEVGLVSVVWVIRRREEEKVNKEGREKENQ